MCHFFALDLKPQVLIFLVASLSGLALYFKPSKSMSRNLLHDRTSHFVQNASNVISSNLVEKAITSAIHPENVKELEQVFPKLQERNRSSPPFPSVPPLPLSNTKTSPKHLPTASPPGTPPPSPRSCSHCCRCCCSRGTRGLRPHPPERSSEAG